MPVSAKDHSTETAIALLGVQIENNHKELNTKLDVMIETNNQQLIHMRDTLDAHKEDTQKKIEDIHIEQKDLKDRVVELEKKNAKAEGIKVAHEWWAKGIWAILGASIAAVFTWIGTNLHLPLHMK